eukprot:jgi/Botrbrau1/4124/Bobra.152_3s0070.1
MHVTSRISLHWDDGDALVGFSFMPIRDATLLQGYRRATFCDLQHPKVSKIKYRLSIYVHVYHPDIAPVKSGTHTQWCRTGVQSD